MVSCFFIEPCIIPKNYPSNPPSVNFINKIYHPLINVETGDLDIKVLHIS